MIIDTQDLDTKHRAASLPHAQAHIPSTSSSSVPEFVYEPNDGEDEPSHTSPLLSHPPPNYQAALATPALAAGRPLARTNSWDDGETELRRRVERRLFRALAIALVIWVLIIGSLKTAVDIAVEIIKELQPKAELPDEANVIRCHDFNSVQWASTEEPMPDDRSALPRYRSRMILALPRTSLNLFSLAKGDLTYGLVLAAEYVNVNASNILVDIEARYYTKDAFRSMRVCEQRGEGNSRGLGVYTPTYTRGKPPTSHQVELVLAYAMPSYQHVESFRTDMPRFTQSLVNLPTMSFGNISLRTTSSNMVVEDLNVEDLSLQTTDGVVVLTRLAAERSISVVTTNAPVDVKNVTLINNKAYRSPVTMSVSSTEGHIQVEDVLLRSDVGYRAFEIDVSTSNGAVRLGIQSPLVSDLQLKARTTNAPVQAVVPPPFEGDVSIRSSRSMVDVWGTFPDVTGARRKYAARSSDLSTATTWQGQIGFDMYPKGKTPPIYGSIDLSTTNAPATVIVPCVLPGPFCKS